MDKTKKYIRVMNNRGMDRIIPADKLDYLMNSFAELRAILMKGGKTAEEAADGFSLYVTESEVPEAELRRTAIAAGATAEEMDRMFSELTMKEEIFSRR